MEIDDRLKEFKDRNPFRIPDGYFENFAENMTNRLPDVPAKQPDVISLYDRVKPWLYMAAAFAGLVILFNVLNRTAETPLDDNGSPEKTTMPVSSLYPESEADENDEFLEYIEDMYTDKYALSYIDDFMDN
ncbi:MAG: hypothetical protein LBJ47_07550 [Tannerella sp.]|jgi:hypothetical protein|nr:hypothetical protein [Tannerella sp.]